MSVRGNLILLLVAAIWGTAFSAQRAGMEHIGPFLYNAVRFSLGCISLLPLWYYMRRTKSPDTTGNKQSAWRAGLCTGLIIFIDLSFQQYGLVYTTAGKTAFITCLYLIIVPLAGIFLRYKVSANVWVGAVSSLTGLYFLCVQEGFSIAYGDWIILGSAFFGAMHILAIGHFARHVDSIQLAISQFFVCSVASFMLAICFEDIQWSYIRNAAIPILYGGILSVGVAYTLQIYGQKYADPVYAVIIMSLESVFGALSGYIFLGELLTLGQLGGCALMLVGVIVSQLGSLKIFRQKAKTAA